MRSERLRCEHELYPDYTAEIDAIETGGITPELLTRIINKHLPNAEFNKALYRRYEVLQDEVPILTRKPRFKDDNDDDTSIINNKIVNDFMGEIVDFKTGYFAGNPIAYSYSRTEESEEDTGGEQAVEEARKALSDFVALNNMFDVDMETTKYASIYGYAGRLFYHDTDGAERVMPLHGFESIILSKTSITEPQYAVRYYQTTDINDSVYWKVQFFDDTKIQYYEGGAIGELNLVKEEQNLYGYCPLQGIPNNAEMIGDTEKVLTLIDAYDRTVSDSSNQIEGEVNSKTVYKNLNITDDEIQKSNYTGAIKVIDPTGKGDVYKLNNSVNDGYTEHHLERLKNNIYRFSKTPNLSDETFGSASGVSLKFKLTGLETKCGMFQAKMMSAGVYMFKLLAKCYNSRKIAFDPLQCSMEFKRNFPLDILSEAQAAQALINAGVPEEVAYATALSFIDDVDYVMQLKEDEKNSIPSLEMAVKEDLSIDDDMDDDKDDDIDDKDDKKGMQK